MCWYLFRINILVTFQMGKTSSKTCTIFYSNFAKNASRLFCNLIQLLFMPWSFFTKYGLPRNPRLHHLNSTESWIKILFKEQTLNPVCLQEAVVGASTKKERYEFSIRLTGTKQAKEKSWLLKKVHKHFSMLFIVHGVLVACQKYIKDASWKRCYYLFSNIPY